MICSPCLSGGEATRQANVATAPGIADRLREFAAQWHGQCESPSTCPCQHHTGPDAIRRD